MKKTMIKAALAGSMLFSLVLGQVAVTNAAAPKPAATAAPVVRDNLSSYGLKKDIELPVTVTAGGFSYTLEKIMIMETKSAAAQALIKKYGYWVDGKYFIWTKITIANKSGNIVEQNANNLSDKWRISFGDSSHLMLPITPVNTLGISNSKEALADWGLKSGEKLSTYQGFSYDGELKYLYIGAKYKNFSEYKDIVLKVK
ncbi:hypothetical protein H70357_06760 [Paenibacillus sp. FSL H7-0357]|uniref:hypothetical protein n=1 Tax=Paenibacillus sp. FSL H7-0357 TaxID=1536774 RepID=UPI0004F5FDCE|nr:hypothetical protein [Paenibacillus sp. FSL H7-0357]AIQ16406.1 hypothetical protein H70357_06760 [Paenibacillus sp. FSL H7-0357]